MGEQADGRSELVAYLQSLGATPEEMRDASATGRLPSLAGDLVLSKRATLSTRELAERAGAGADRVVAIWRSLGVDAPLDAEARFSEADADLTAALLGLEAVLREEGQHFLRVIASSMTTVADAAVAAYVQTVEQEHERAGTSELARARENEATVSGVLHIFDLIGAVLVQHLRQAIERQRISQAEVSARTMVKLAVGFVDLVGSTPLALHSEPDALLDFVGSFEAHAFDAAAGRGGRIVKHIGDEVMFVTIDAAEGCRLALELVGELGDGRAQPRGGLSYGDLLTRHGDYYGPVVNLASRLTDAAIPGEVLVDDSVPRAVRAADLAFEPGGRRQLKGFDEPVRVSTLVARPAAGRAPAEPGRRQ